jgi:hypothetical protein
VALRPRDVEIRQERNEDVTLLGKAIEVMADEFMCNPTHGLPAH